MSGGFAEMMQQVLMEDSATRTIVVRVVPDIQHLY
jgi:hypothetical protein